MSDIDGLDSLYKKLVVFNNDLTEVSEKISYITGKTDILDNKNSDLRNAIAYQHKRSDRDKPFNAKRKLPPTENGIFHQVESQISVKKGRVFPIPPTRKSELDEALHPDLPSVVSIPKPKTRDDKVVEINYRAEDVSRGRRFLGMMLGHLRQARAENEAENRTERAVRRHEVEEKVKQQEAEEKSRYQEERRQLIETKRSTMRKANQIRAGIRAADSFKRWSENQTKMMKYIRTQNLPGIFYRPKVFCDVSQERLIISQKFIEELINVRKLKLESEIQELNKNVGACEEVPAVDSMQAETGELESLSDRSSPDEDNVDCLNMDEQEQDQQQQQQRTFDDVYVERLLCVEAALSEADVDRLSPSAGTADAGGLVELV